ncbi:MAG: hypothetical protein R3E68_16250 [Burkholderiaceae bacterium]
MATQDNTPDDARGGDTVSPAGPARQQTSASSAEDDIPMLTDILPVAVRPRLVEDPVAFDEPAWNRMALKIEANVMQRMLRHSDRLVDGPLVERLDELLERSAQRLIEDIRSTMRETVREAVSRAIAEELGKARASYKRDAR